MAATPCNPAPTPDAADVVKLPLALLHRHPLGELTPYFRGLQAGRAVATRCPTCGRTWFPPRLDCPEHGGGVQWVELSGRAQVVSVTVTQGVLPFGSETARRVFALVALEGAENLAFARLAGAAEFAGSGAWTWISRAVGVWPHPAQSACFVANETERQLEPLP